MVKVTTWRIRSPKIVEWTPQEDITAFELAKCIPLIAYRPSCGFYPEDHIPDGCERHFTIKDYDNG